MDNIDCTTCGDTATHLYAVWDPRHKTHSSVNGYQTWSPSCDDCDDPEIVEPQRGLFRISAPLLMWPLLPESHR